MSFLWQDLKRNSSKNTSHLLVPVSFGCNQNLKINRAVSFEREIKEYQYVQHCLSLIVLCLTVSIKWFNMLYIIHKYILSHHKMHRKHSTQRKTITIFFSGHLNNTGMLWAEVHYDWTHQHGHICPYWNYTTITWSFEANIMTRKSVYFRTVIL